MRREDLIYKVARNHFVETAIQEKAKQKILKGSLHLSLGQEAIDVGIIAACDSCIVYGNHRSHGQYLEATDDVSGLFQELRNGIGGSQHLYFPNKFMSNGIQGGMIPIAFGHAFAMLKKKKDTRIICFIGDGTLGNGTLYEVLNMLSVFHVPLSIVVINNGYAMSQTIGNVSVEGLAKAFNIPYCHLLDTQNVFQMHTRMYHHFKMLEDNPSIIYASCIRLCGHSSSDIQAYRPKNEKSQEYLSSHSPMAMFTESEIAEVKPIIEVQINKAIEQWEHTVTK